MNPSRVSFDIAFIGGGNMATALINGLLRKKIFKASRIVATDVQADALKKLKQQFNVHTSSDNAEAVAASSVVVLAVKPQAMGTVLDGLASSVCPQHLVISIAAGIPISFLEKKLGATTPIIRVMPNTPALQLEGASGLAAGQAAGASHMNFAQTIFNAVGKTVVVDEKSIDAITALSGSGPAYVFYLAEAMQMAGERLGLDPAVSDLLTRQTLRGAGILLAQSADPAAELRRRVTSPGGTTERAIQFFDENRLKDVVVKAIEYARQRAEELSKVYAS